MTLFNWKKELHLCAGLPGSGKSTLALSLVGSRDQVVENDDYWYTSKKECDVRKIFGPFMWHVKLGNLGEKSWEYRYEPQMIRLAGDWCGAEAFRRLRLYDKVAVANTFIKREHILSYAEEARRLGVRVFLHRPKTEWANNVEECFKRNVHAVPMEVLQRMQDSWEPITQEEIDVYVGQPKKD